MSIPPFIGMTVGDLFAELEACKERLAHAAATVPPNWVEVGRAAHQACFLSQCMVSEIVARRRRRDMPCTQAKDLLLGFATVAADVLHRHDPTRDSSFDDIERYIENMRGRALELEETGRRSHDLDQQVFYLETTEEAVTVRAGGRSAS